ncbi:hypothetical protein PI124_g556 [Phytophthora idaei]|nr:hypothetical protein PI125_g4281 [Phytophthora idaei]KAG3254887.1 hypothetical protein PI124_g556 [Phytophthora idaei]
MKVRCITVTYALLALVDGFSMAICIETILSGWLGAASATFNK